MMIRHKYCHEGTFTFEAGGSIDNLGKTSLEDQSTESQRIGHNLATKQ